MSEGDEKTRVKYIRQLQAELELSNAEYEMNRIEYQLGLRRIELYGEVGRRGGGWNTARARELTDQVRDIETRWLAAVARVRELRTARFKPPTRPAEVSLDRMTGGPYVGTSHG